MSPETFFLLYAVQQHWLTESQAEELWNKAQDDKKDLDKVALEMGLLDESQVKQGREVVGLELDAMELLHIGDHDIVECVGRGAHGAVFRAQPELHSDNVAMKVLAPRLLDDLLYLENFAKRAEAVHKQEIENAATTLESGESDGHYYLISEYAEGTSLAKQVKDNGALPEKAALNIARHLAKALIHAEEEGLTHLGISPADIMLMPEGDILLLDLGLAKEVHDKVLLQVAFKIGAEHYYAPEQAIGEEGDIRTDIFRLGASIYYAITAQAPFSGKTSNAVIAEKGESVRTIPSPKNYCPELAQGFGAVLNRMMGRQPEDRYQTASELVADLNSLSEGKQPENASIEDGKSILASAPETTELSSAPASKLGENEEGQETGSTSKDGEEKDEPAEIDVPDETESRRVEIPPTQRVPAIDVTKEKERRRSTGTMNRARRERNKTPAKKKSIAPILGFAIPAILVIIAIIFMVMKKDPKDTNRVGPKGGPPTTKLDPHLQKLDNEYRAIQKYMTPDQLETAREKLNEHIEHVKNIPPFLKRAKGSLKQISKLEKQYYDQQKEKMKSAVPPSNLMLNGGFEDDDEGKPRYWLLSGKTGARVSEDAATGKHCLSVWSVYDQKSKRTSASQWIGSVSPIDPMQTYKVSFKLKTDLWRRDSKAYISIGHYRRTVEPKTKWTDEEFVFVAPTLADHMIPYDSSGQPTPKNAEVRLSVSGRPGKVFFDDLRIVRVKPWNKKIVGIELGAGEDIQNTGYSFRMNMGSKAPADNGNTNYSRCLQNFAASSAQDGWDLNENQYVLYAHEIEQFTQKERGMINVRSERHHKDGAILKVEISNDSAEWITLKTFDKPDSAAMILPKEIFPAETLYVRFSATGPCRLTYYTYKVSLEHNETKNKRLSGARGESEFVE